MKNVKFFPQSIYLGKPKNIYENIIGGINLVESDAVTNGIFSFFIPGLGQAIEGYKLRGAILFVVAVIISAIFIYFKFNQTIHHIILVVYGLIAAYDAYRLY